MAGLDPTLFSGFIYTIASMQHPNFFFFFLTKGMSPVYNCEGRNCSFMNTYMCTLNTLRLNKEVFTLFLVLWVKAHFYCTLKILSVYLSRSISVFIIHLFIHLFIYIM